MIDVKVNFYLINQRPGRWTFFWKYDHLTKPGFNINKYTMMPDKIPNEAAFKEDVLNSLKAEWPSWAKDFDSTVKLTFHKLTDSEFEKLVNTV